MIVWTFKRRMSLISQKRVFFLSFSIILWFLVGLGCSSDYSPSESWLQYQTPDSAGWSVSDLEQARQFAESIRSGAVMGIYRGHVLFAWGDVQRLFRCHSVRKSLLSGLIGIYVENNTIDLDETIEELGIDDIQPLSQTEKQATVLQLLKARSGIYHPAAKETSSMERERPERGSHLPGEFFWYNNWDFNILGVIFEQKTGRKIFKAFQDHIAQPVGMQDYKLGEQFYQYARSKSKHPAYAFRMSARDLARFGQLYLQNGKWDDKQVIPSDWVRESTSGYSKVNPGTQYGYMWWVYPEGELDPEKYPTLNQWDKFAAIGTGGQLVLVIPEAEFVLVHRGDTDFGSGVSGPNVWKLAEIVMQSRNKKAEKKPELEALSPIPFLYELPPLGTHEEIDLPPEVLESYTGTYQLTPKVQIIIRRFGNQLAAEMTGPQGGEADIFPSSKNHFFGRAVQLEITFIRDDSNEISGLLLDFGGRIQKAEKIK